MAGRTPLSQFLKSVGSNQNEAAKVIGISSSTFSLKAQGFTDDEIRKMADFYSVDQADIEKMLKGEPYVPVE